MQEDILVRKHPRLFHMAEAGSWPQISEMGLMSSNAIAHSLKLTSEERFKLLSKRRDAAIAIQGITFRDHGPLNEKMLAKCLTIGSTQEWFELLNKKVFFWLSWARLERFLLAYGMKRQLILEIPTQVLVERYRERISLCHLNSGAVRDIKHKRGPESFQKIPDYKYNSRNSPAELTVEGTIPDIKFLVSRVYETGGGYVDKTLYLQA